MKSGADRTFLARKRCGIDHSLDCLLQCDLLRCHSERQRGISSFPSLCRHEKVGARPAAPASVAAATNSRVVPFRATRPRCHSERQRGIPPPYRRSMYMTRLNRPCPVFPHDFSPNRSGAIWPPSLFRVGRISLFPATFGPRLCVWAGYRSRLVIGWRTEGAAARLRAPGNGPLHLGNTGRFTRAAPAPTGARMPEPRIGGCSAQPKPPAALGRARSEFPPLKG